MHSTIGTTSNSHNLMQEEPSMEPGLTNWKPMKRLKYELVSNDSIGADSRNLHVPNQNILDTGLHKMVKTIVRIIE